jgi:hypothetical protein
MIAATAAAAAAAAAAVAVGVAVVQHCHQVLLCYVIQIWKFHLLHQTACKLCYSWPFCCT